MDINGVSLDVQIYKEKIGDLFYIDILYKYTQFCISFMFVGVLMLLTSLGMSALGVSYND